MTRSQAVKIISSLIANDMYCKWMDVSVENVADNILETLEQLGMKPPLEKVDPITLRTEHYWKNENNG